jgi:hypothetical protein
MQAEIDCTRNAANIPTRTCPNEFVVIANCVASLEWQVDFARVYAARERCTSDQAGRAASILCESLSARRWYPIVDVGLRRLTCRRAGVAAVRERTLEPLRMDDFFVTARDLSADDDK